MKRAVLLVLTALALAGCGGSGGSDRPGEDVTLMLDFQANAVHAGIYSAVARGFDDAEGVSITVRQPGASTDPVKLLAGGRIDLAVLDIHDLALARETGSDFVGVMAVVQRPLAAILARPGIRTPRDLEGERVGVTGLPSDRAVLRSIVAGAGGDPSRVRMTTIGFTAVASLLSGKVAGATAFWNAEGLALRARRPAARIFRVDDFGAPAYPELVLAVTRRTLDERGDVVRAVVHALVRGYERTLNDPEGSVSDLRASVRGLDRRELLEQLDVIGPAFTAGAEHYGELDPVRLRAWARWEERFRITRERPNVERAFTGRYVPRD